MSRFVHYSRMCNEKVTVASELKADLVYQLFNSGEYRLAWTLQLITEFDELGKRIVSCLAQ